MKNKNQKLLLIIMLVIIAVLLAAVVFLIVAINDSSQELTAYRNIASQDTESESEGKETDKLSEEQTSLSDVSTEDIEEDTEEITESIAESQESDTGAFESTTTDNGESQYNVGDLTDSEAEPAEDDYPSQYLIDGWENMLSKMDYDADIVFLGDSITARGDFRKYFPEYNVVNMGLGGDTILGITRRAGMLRYLNPEKIVILCGVNVLRTSNIDQCIEQYADLLDSVYEAVPNAELYVCSILPMAQGWQDAYCPKEVTENFNYLLSLLCLDYSAKYVDLYSSFVADGVIAPELTSDGIHLSDAGYDLWANIISGYIYY